MSMPATLELSFASAFSGCKKRGPFARLRFEGEVLREIMGGPIIAKHEDHQWVLNGDRYTRIDCDCRVMVHFERVDGSASRTYGPFESFSCSDGIAYTDRKLFAFVDRSIVDWYCHDNGRHWPLMIVVPAA